MVQLSYRRHRFPPAVIQHAIWLYLRFTLSYRDVEDLLVERGLEVSNETIRRWVLRPHGDVQASTSGTPQQRFGCQTRNHKRLPRLNNFVDRLLEFGEVILRADQ